MVKFDGTLSDWLCLIFVCAVYLLSRYWKFKQTTLTKEQKTEIIAALIVWEDLYIKKHGHSYSEFVADKLIFIDRCKEIILHKL